MTEIPFFSPTAENLYVLTYPETGERVNAEYDFQALLHASRQLERKEKIEEACNLRYEAFQKFAELIPENEEITLDCEDDATQAALELVRASAIDHFLIGDLELAAGMFELLLDLDPEDHFEATKQLAYCYVALEEYELFDEIINDISDKYPEKEILKLWSEFRREGKFAEGELIHFRKSFPYHHAEFTADSHEVSPEFLADIDSERPSREAQARELWLQTEHLWAENRAFIEALRGLRA